MIEFVKSVFRLAIKFIGISLIYLSNFYNPALFCKLMQQWPYRVGYLGIYGRNENHCGRKKIENEIIGTIGIGEYKQWKIIE